MGVISGSHENGCNCCAASSVAYDTIVEDLPAESWTAFLLAYRRISQRELPDDVKRRIRANARTRRVVRRPVVIPDFDSLMLCQEAME